MSKEKMDNAKMLDPNRFKIAQEMSVLPGGPMMNNPMNVTNINPQVGALDGIIQYPYGDSGVVNDPRLGAVFPQQNSGLPGNLVVGRGLNGASPYGGQMQPSSSAADPLESARLAEGAAGRGLVAGPMGMIGQAPNADTSTLQAPLSGGGVPSPQQTNQVLGLQGVPSTDMPTGGVNMKSGKRSK